MILGAAAFFGTSDGALQVFQAVSRLFKQGLYIGRHRLVAIAAPEAAAAKPGVARQPFLQIVVESVLSLACVQVQKAEHQAA